MAMKAGGSLRPMIGDVGYALFKLPARRQHPVQSCTGRCSTSTGTYPS
jgi:hypothetical protein